MNRKNSYDFIRLFAAVVVIFSHSFALTGNPEPSLGGVTFGTIALWIFFILSGYLIAKSWDQYPRFNVFFAKRLLRIMPGLIVAVVSTIVVAGLFFTTLPLISYFTHPGILAYTNNILLYNTTYFLPGVFENNIYPNAVNGSIWTLAYEFSLYLSVAFIGVLKLYKKITPFTLWLILFFLVVAVITVGKEFLNVSLFYLNIGSFLTLGLMFFSGVMMHKYENKIHLDTFMGVGALVLFIILSIFIPIGTPLYASVLFAYAIFALGRHPTMSWLSKYGDFSYGLYIYAFPIQQMISATTNTTSPLKMFLLSTTITGIVAILSWYLVEAKALKWKDRINMKKYPIIQADEAW